MTPDPAAILERLRAASNRLAIAESFTGGLLADAFIRVPGASDVVAGGVLAYADDAKTRLLRVKPETLRAHGAVSAETALEMARGAADALAADHGVATTGIAGPAGATASKPLGLSFCAAVGPSGHAVTERVHEGGRDTIRRAGVDQALETLASILP